MAARQGGRPLPRPLPRHRAPRRARSRATGRPHPGGRERPAPGGADATDALELALLLADEDARAGDYAQALHALDAAAALAGGVLPAAAAAKREAWLAALAPSEHAHP